MNSPLAVLSLSSSKILTSASANMPLKGAAAANKSLKGKSATASKAERMARMAAMLQEATARADSEPSASPLFPSSTSRRARSEKFTSGCVIFYQPPAAHPAHARNIEIRITTRRPRTVQDGSPCFMLYCCSVCAYLTFRSCLTMRHEYSTTPLSPHSWTSSHVTPRTRTFHRSHPHRPPNVL